MKINNLMKRLSATIVAIALTFSSLVLPLDAIASVSSSTAATEDTNTDNSGEGGVSGDSDKSGDNSGEETPDEGLISKISITAVRATGQTERSACRFL